MAVSGQCHTCQGVASAGDSPGNRVGLLRADEVHIASVAGSLVDCGLGTARSEPIFTQRRRYGVSAIDQSRYGIGAIGCRSGSLAGSGNFNPRQGAAIAGDSPSDRVGLLHGNKIHIASVPLALIHCHFSACGLKSVLCQARSDCVGPRHKTVYCVGPICPRSGSLAVSGNFNPRQGVAIAHDSPGNGVGLLRADEIRASRMRSSVINCDVLAQRIKGVLSQRGADRVSVGQQPIYCVGAVGGSDR